MMGRDFSSLWTSVNWLLPSSSVTAAGQLTWTCAEIEIHIFSFGLVSILFICLLFFHSSSFFSLTNSTHVIALHQIFVFNWIELQDERWFRGRIRYFPFTIRSLLLSQFYVLVCIVPNTLLQLRLSTMCVRVLVINVNLVTITQQQ